MMFREGSNTIRHRLCVSKTGDMTTFNGLIQTSCSLFGVCFFNLLVVISPLKTLVPGFVSLPGTVLSAGSGVPPAAVPPRYSFDVRELTAHPVQEAPAPVSGACSPSK